MINFILVNQEIVKVVQPIFLGKVIRYFESYNPEDLNALYESLGYAAGLSLCTLGLVVLHHLYFYYVQRAGMKIRVAMCHMIYKKVRTRQGNLSTVNEKSGKSNCGATKDKTMSLRGRQFDFPHPLVFLNYLKPVPQICTASKLPNICILVLTLPY